MWHSHGIPSTNWYFKHLLVLNHHHLVAHLLGKLQFVAHLCPSRSTAQLKHSFQTWSSMIIHRSSLNVLTRPCQWHTNGCAPSGVIKPVDVSYRQPFCSIVTSNFCMFWWRGRYPCSCFCLKKAGMFSYLWNFRYRKSNPWKKPLNKMFFWSSRNERTKLSSLHGVALYLSRGFFGEPKFLPETIKKNMANKTSRVVYYGGPMEVSNYCSFVSWFTSWNNPFTSCTMDIPMVWPLLKEMNTIWLCRFFFENLLASPPSGFSREPVVFSKYIKGDFMVPSTDQWDWFVYLQWMVDFYGVFVDIPFVTWIPKRFILLMEEIPNYMNGWFLWDQCR